jgi:hypothetical protein
MLASKRSPQPIGSTEKRANLDIAAVNSAAVAQVASVCRKLLSEGDGILSSISQSFITIAAVFRRSRLEAAKLSFEEALKCANQIGHLTHKAEAERGLFRVVCEQLDEQSAPECLEVVHFYSKAMRHASLAIWHGVEAQMESNWIWSIKVDCFELAREFCLKEDNETTAAFMGRLHKSSLDASFLPEMRYIMMHTIVQKQFQAAVRCLSALDHEGCIKDLSHSARALFEVSSLFPHRHLFFMGATGEQRKALEWLAAFAAELKNLQDDHVLHMNIANAGLMIKQGDYHLTQALSLSADFMTPLFMAMDCFKQAIVYAGSEHGCDLEHEAWACSRLGTIYTKVGLGGVKQPAIGNRYYKKCIELVFCLAQARSCENKQWFREAQHEVEAYQSHGVLRDQKAVTEKREPFLLMIAKEMAPIRKYKRVDHLLNFLSKMYGSPGIASLPVEPNNGHKKKRILHVMRHFDPVKCADEDSGEFGPHIFTRKKVLHEEITRILNRHYETGPTSEGCKNLKR